MSQVHTEVLVIGGGIIGAAVARELSKYNVDATIVEKEADVGWGISKTSFNIVKQGSEALSLNYDIMPHKIKLCWDSMPLIEPLCKELDVPFMQLGELRVFRNKAEKEAYADPIPRLAEKWQSAGVMPKHIHYKWLDQEGLRKREPYISKDFIGALYCEEDSTIDGVRLTQALVENARQNGVNLLLGTEVSAISPGPLEFTVETNNGTIKCRYIVNAAGEYADKVARLANADDFVLFPVAQYCGILDKKLEPCLNHFITLGHDNLCLTKTIHGNIFFTGANSVWKRHYHGTKKWVAETAIEDLRIILPDVSPKNIIRSFMGFLMVRSVETPWHECVCDVSRWVPRFINISMGYPGIAPAPAVAKQVVEELLVSQGLKLEKNLKFNPYRKAIPNFSEVSDEERARLIDQDKKFGHIVCRCETVTEGEIVEAIRRGARTVEGVKFRCRPGMGRCQGSFCTPRVMAILARELNIPEEEVTMKGPNSRHLLFKSKDLLRRQSQ